MKLLIDKMDSITGWTGSTPEASVHGLNQIPDYIAGLGNNASLIFKFSGALNQYVEKDVSFDLTNYDEIVFWIWSRNKKRKGYDYQNSGDFAYKIEFGTGDEFYIPTSYMFTDITINISGITTIDKIKITCLHNNEDYLIVSSIMAIKDELPLDIFQGLKEQLEYDIGLHYSKISSGVLNKGILIGSITGINSGDTSFILESGLPYAEKYAVIRFDDGINSEMHQIEKTDGTEFFFNSMHDGVSFLNDYTSANIYLTIPVEFNLKEKEIILPGIAIWGMNPEEIFRGSKIEEKRDTFKTDESVMSRQDQAIFKYNILVDGEARHDYLIAQMNRVIRTMIVREFIWVNNKKIDIKPSGPSTYVDPIEGYNEIPKIQYELNLEVKEELWDRTKLVKTVDNVREYIILN